jgi:hypothetical protein
MTDTPFQVLEINGVTYLLPHRWLRALGGALAVPETAAGPAALPAGDRAPGRGGGSVNLTEQLLRQHDESFRDGSIAVVESIEDALNSWQFQLLIRIAPRWTLRKFRERISDVLPLPQAGEVSHG